MRVTDIDFRKTMVQWPKMADWWTSMHHDDQTSLATKEVDEQLEEGVECEGFVDISKWIDPESHFERGK